MRAVVLSIVIAMIGVANGQKLSDEENFNRVRDCGNVELPEQNNVTRGVVIPEEWWITELFRPIDYYQFQISLGTFISSRHILTFPRLIYEGNHKWITGEAVGECNADGSIEVPRPVVSHIETSECGKCVKKGLILDCERLKKNQHVPMILTLKASVTNRKFPCLTNKNITVKVGDQVDAYEVWSPSRHPSSELKGRYGCERRNLSEVNATYLRTDTDRVSFDYGGPLMKMVDGKYTMIAMSNLDYENNSKNMFYNLGLLEKVICSNFNICLETVAPTTAAPPTTTTPLKRFDFRFEEDDPSDTDVGIGGEEFDGTQMENRDDYFYTDNEDSFPNEAERIQNEKSADRCTIFVSLTLFVIWLI